MKKKFLLAIIPAILALSACNGGASKEKENVKNDFLEDCLAHEDIFGEVNLEDRPLQPRRALDPALNPDVCYEHPTIGVQSFYDSEKNEVSFRFVAAVTMNSESIIANSSATWTRCVSKTDCSSYPLDESTPAPTINKAYKALSNDGGSYTIDQYNHEHADEDGDTHYTHFVVYTLRNIKLSNYPGSSYYVSAYLTMSGDVTGEAEYIYSKAIAIRFDGAKKYTYVHNVGTGYIEGTFGGTPTIKEKTAVEDDTNAASFKELSIAKNDTFVIKAFDGTKLRIRNVSNFTGDNNHSSYYFINDNGQMKANFSGKYDIYLNSAHQIYTNGQNIVRPIYISLDENASWWHNASEDGESSAWTAVYAFGASGHHWYKTTAEGNYFVTSAEINPTVYTTIIAVRMKGSSSGKTEDQLDWADRFKNQTVDMLIPNDSEHPENNFKDCLYLKDGTEGNYDGYSKKYADWGYRS